jgi:hypothetical protein
MSKMSNSGIFSIIHSLNGVALPEPSKEDNLLNSIEIFNNTQYILTIRYSGIESKKVVMSPKQRTSLSLKNGNYRIAASVNASNVRNYAGNENLSAGEYTSEYYIRTRTY